MTSPSPAAEANARMTPLEVLLVLGQLSLVALAAYFLHIEERNGLSLVLPLVVVGFAIHAVLPPRWRPAFFLFLSLASIPLVLGLRDGLLLIGAGLVLFRLCHLPGRWAVAALLAAGAGLALIRAGTGPLPWLHEIGGGMVPLLAAMFMFRVAIYLHDIRHEREPVPLTQRLAYFFMLPNICFPLFPVVDYRTFLREYYSAPALATCQKGISWIVRGIVHLLLYRLVYYHWTPTFDQVTNLSGVIQYVVSSYLLYLRVSGMFHVAIGILCLFGYNLPETHRLYFLASSFTDFWRRINIYWKDFVMKVLYYPMFMRLKKLGMAQAVMIASLGALVGSWLLHSYQTFWLRGSFPVTIQDAVFWTFLGVAVAVNAVLELRAGRTRAGATDRRPVRSAFILSLKTVGMFSFMAVLWSFWSTSSVEEWFAVMAVAARAEPLEFLALVAGLAGLVAAGTAAQLILQWNWVLSSERPRTVPLAAAGNVAVALVAILVSNQATTNWLGERLPPAPLRVWVSVTSRSVANFRDQEAEARGYYEELLGKDAARQAEWTREGTSLLKRLVAMAGVAGLPDAVQGTGDARRYELRPSLALSYKGVPFHTNRWGMRDREYDPEAPPGTCRALLFGDSHTMGSGVADGATYEAVLEESLNRERPIAGCERYEVLNFGVAGYSALQSALHARKWIPVFRPDVVFYASSHPEPGWAAQRVALALAENSALEEPYLQEIAARVGIAPGMNEYEMRQRLAPVQDELVSWAYRSLVEDARAQGAGAVWMMLPRFDLDQADVAAQERKLSRLAADAGFTTVSLIHAFDGEDPASLEVAPWDKHPNARANAIIARHMLVGLKPHLERIKISRATREAPASSNGDASPQLPDGSGRAPTTEESQDG